MNTTFGRTALVCGGYEQLGSLKRHDDTEKIDYGFANGFTVEGGLGHNYFECCLALEDHTGYIALQHASPGLTWLHGLHFIYTEKAITAAYNPGAHTPASHTAGPVSLRHLHRDGRLRRRKGHDVRARGPQPHADQ